MERLRVVVVLGHPRGAGSLCGALAAAYAQGAEEAGARVERFDLSQAEFDPHVRLASPRAQPLEDDLERIRAAIDRCDHLALVYPTWWGTFPALLKGFLDRALLPGWAFAEIEGGAGYEGLLKGKTADLLTTMDTPGPVYRFVYGAPGHRALARATLGFCGVDTVRIARFGAARSADAATRARWLAEARALGARLGHGPRGAFGRLFKSMSPWVAALRLQFYPMTFLAYWVGALAGAGADAVRRGEFWLGYAFLFALEAATVFVNDLFDYESDRRNACWGPFTGGSRVLVCGDIARATLARAAALAAAVAALLAAPLVARSPTPAVLAVYLAAFGALAIGYTAPPLKLSHRALGEADVALTHSFGVLVLGYALQAGAWGEGAPYLLALPLFFAVAPAIVLSGIPDADADAAAGKVTLTVRFGTRGAARIALASLAASVALAVALPLAGVAALRGLEIVAPIHALWFGSKILAYLRTGAGARRIDGAMAAGLTYIAWFALVPLFHLLR